MKLSEIEVFIIYRYECRAYTVNYYRRITHNTKLRFTIYRKKYFQKLFNPRRSISYDIYNRVTHPLLLLLLRFASKDTHERIRTSERKSKFNEHVSLPVRDYAKRTRTRNAKFKKSFIVTHRHTFAHRFCELCTGTRVIYPPKYFIVHVQITSIALIPLCSSYGSDGTTIRIRCGMFFEIALSLLGFFFFFFKHLDE